MPLPFRSLSASKGCNSSPRSQVINKGVANVRKSDPLDLDDGAHTSVEKEDEDDTITKRLSELQEELFISLKEDISDWIVQTLGDVDITAESFIHALDTGVILCRLSLAIEKKAKECFEQGIIKEPLPTYKLHCNKSANSGTWFARDNTTNFLKWCRAYGMTDESLFDSEDLVAHHHERQVIYCLMELARLGARFGLEPPSLITMEKEIDSELTPPRTPAPRESPIPVEIIPKEEETPPPPPLSPVVEAPRVKKESVSSSKSSTVSTLDSEVNRVCTKCKCQEYVNKLSEGVYNVFGKRVFIRLLKGKHLMVRVGGGWDTFENYLLHHDPIQVFEFHQSNPNGPAHTVAYSKESFKPGAFNGYLVIRSKYKSNSFNK